MTPPAIPYNSINIAVFFKGAFVLYGGVISPGIWSVRNFLWKVLLPQALIISGNYLYREIRTLGIDTYRFD